MDNGVSLASIGSKIFDGVFGFLPDWIKITVLALVLLAVVASWAVKIKRKLDRRRAMRQGPSPAAAAQHRQPQGADYLGPYAPGASGASGASGAPGVSGARQAPAVPAQRQPSGADFLGAYAPQQGQGRREG